MSAIQEKNELLTKGRINGFITKKDIINAIDEIDEEETCDEIFAFLDENDIEVKEEDFNDEKEFYEDELINEIEDIKNNEEFTNFSKDIEDELIRSADIEDYNINNTSVNDTFKAYLSEIGSIPLLTQNEEYTLSQKVQDGISAQIELEKIKNGKKKGTPEKIEKLEYIIEEGKYSENRFVEANLRLVVYTAKKYSHRGLSIEDLVQEGNIGLIKAVKKFNPTMGFRFCTYSIWWIRQAITRAIADQTRIIRIPVYLTEKLNRMAKIMNKLRIALDREPTDEEIAKEMNEKIEKIKFYRLIFPDTECLDDIVNKEDNTTRSDFVPDSNPNAFEYAMEEKFKEAIELLLDRLSQKEKDVIKLKYGLIDGRTHTLEEVGIAFNLTRERIRQIEVNALIKMRHPSNRNIIRYIKDCMRT